MIHTIQELFEQTLRFFSASGCGQPFLFCLEFILAVEARSVSLFADSIAFLEGASASVLLSSGRNWSMPGREAFARFSSTIILIPTCFLFWMIAANYYGTAIPSATPLAATGTALLLTNIACLVMLKHGMFAHLADSLPDVRNHAIMNAVIVLAAFLTWASGAMWPDVLASLGILCVNAGAVEDLARCAAAVVASRSLI